MIEFVSIGTAILITKEHVLGTARKRELLNERRIN